MKFKLGYIIIILIISAIAKVQLEDSQLFKKSKFTDQAIVNVEAANLRSEPSKEASIKTNVNKSDTLKVLNKGEWLEVESAENVNGFIHSSLVKSNLEFTKEPIDFNLLSWIIAFGIGGLGYVFYPKVKGIEDSFRNRNDNKNRLLSRTGIAYFTNQDYQTAIEYFKRALKKNAKDSSSLSYMAKAYKKLQMFDDSAKAFKHFTQIHPKHSNSYFDLAKVYYLQYEESNDEAFKTKSYKAIMKSIELDPDNKRLHLAKKDIENNEEYETWAAHSFGLDKTSPKDPVNPNNSNNAGYNGNNNTTKKKPNMNYKNDTSKNDSGDSSKDDDFFSKLFKPKPLHKIRAYMELSKMIGMDGVKSDIKESAALINLELNSKKQTKAKNVAAHYIFYGPPGTGKTTVARLLGEILRDIGYLRKGHVVEVKRNDLVGEYIGQTAIKTKEKIEEAKGGVLFIDEAYSLYNEGKDFGKEAVETLLTEMENERGKFIVIAAGYPDNMKTFLNMNPGLKSRFTNNVNFKDFNPDELLEIFQMHLKDDDFTIDSNANDLVHQYLSDIYENKDKNFGNGRDVRKLFEFIKKKFAVRVLGQKRYERNILHEDVIAAIETLQNNKL